MNQTMSAKGPASARLVRSQAETSGSASGGKKIAIILVNFNGLKYLEDCLTSLTRLDYPNEDYKIFLVDNGSTDGSLAYAQKNFPALEFIINSKNLGFAEGNNIGIAKALSLGYDYIYLINQDTVSEADSLKKLAEVLQSDEKISAVQARLMLWPEKDKVNSLGNSIHYLGFGFSSGGYQKFEGDLKPKETAYPSGAAVLIKADVLRRIGLFDINLYLYHEDLDLGWRMRMSGYKILVAPEAVVYHKYEFSRSITKYYYMERNRFVCLLENYKIGTLILIFPAWLIMELGMLLFSIKSGFFGEKLKVYGYFLRLSSWCKIIRGRKAKKGKRVRKDRDIINLFVGKIEFQEIDNWLLRNIANPIFNLYWQIIKHLIIW